MENPFKFGTIVEEEYFTDRIEEVAYIRHFVESANHLVLISPRRFGKSSVVAESILDYTDCHPYYSQQLAANVWNISVLQPEEEDALRSAVDHIVISHSLDYERLWMNMKRTNKWILQNLAKSKTLQTGEYPTSTIYSALKRLQKEGYVIYSNSFEIEDPFFKEWIIRSS